MHIVRTGAANLASVVAAFDRLGVKTVLTTDPVDAWKAERLVLPGVGAFGAAMQALRAAGLVEPLRERILAGKPTLAVCLGLQLFAETSEESPGATGLGVLSGRVTRFAGAAGLTVPQMGWNRFAAMDAGSVGTSVLRDGWGYYANSYKLDAIPPGWAGAVSDYGGPFVAAVERGAVVACQFHPELSGVAGLALIERWLHSPSQREGAGGRAQKAQGDAMSGDARTHPQPPPSGRGLTRVIPCLDVRDGRVVKGVKFQNLRDAGDPAAQAAEYERQGADELVMLDVSATPEGRKTAGDTVRAIRRVLSIPLTVGGGVRTVDDAARLLDAGADKVGVNTAAVERPALIAELAEKFGRQCVVLAIDAALKAHSQGGGREGVGGGFESARSTGGGSASTSASEPTTPPPPSGRGSWEVVVHSGKTRTGLDAVAWAERGAELGAGEILLTSYDRDGTGEGYDLDLLREVCAAVRVPVIASGGARTAEHLAAAVGAGAGAVLAASIFHDGVHTVGAVKSELNQLGVAVRTEPA